MLLLLLLLYLYIYNGLLVYGRIAVLRYVLACITERAAGEIELKEECEALKQQLRCARDEAAMLEQRLQDAAESERDALEREVSRCRVLVGI